MTFIWSLFSSVLQPSQHKNARRDHYFIIIKSLLVHMIPIKLLQIRCRHIGLLDRFYPYPSGLLYWHWGNHIAIILPVKQAWRIWVMNQINHSSLWPGDAIWRRGTRSTLAQVMACCLTAPSHYLNQCWLIIREVPWHSSGCIIIRKSE